MARASVCVPVCDVNLSSEILLNEPFFVQSILPYTSRRTGLRSMGCMQPLVGSVPGIVG
ncbi:hypothetical protein WN944_026170 [Citrus x changshan-huyou]|uniref:Uncharacterized protein n=1 Tax=Citrus x changshan-huyou TaxID=2935761 RepID=A0AAP0QD05_9ROSI